MRAFFFILLFSFSIPVSFAMESPSAKKAKSSQEPEKRQQPLKKARQKAVPPLKRALKKPKAERQANSIGRASSVEKKPYKPKVEKTVLREGFSKYLSELNKNCGLDSGKRRAGLNKKIKEFTHFLTESLKDPYMDYQTTLLFVDVLSVMEKENLESPSNFNRAYKLLYNISEKVQPKDYEHEWARVIYTSIECSETASA